MADAMKRLWLVTVERTLTAKVLAWAETTQEARLIVEVDSPLDEYGFEPETSENSWAQLAVMSSGRIAPHHMGFADPVYGDQDGIELTVHEAVTIETGDITALPEHLAALALKRKESSNGQLPLIQ
jgi:hypothetical protein